MTKIQIVVELTIDDSEESIDTILSEMDYNFSCISNELGQIGEELIWESEILKRINKTK